MSDRKEYSAKLEGSLEGEVCNVLNQNIKITINESMIIGAYYNYNTLLNEQERQAYWDEQKKFYIVDEPDDGTEKETESKKQIAYKFCFVFKRT